MLLGLKWAGIAALVLVLIMVGGAVYLYKTTDIPDPDKSFQTQTTNVYYDDGKTQIGNFHDQNRVSISYNDMPPVIKNAVVAAEDRTFWTNNGIDLKGIIRAATSNARGNATQGASTITQQYVKILYLGQATGHLSYKEKLKEIFLALKIHRKLTKTDILKGYLNTIYFGRGAYGIEAASQAYFETDAKDLTLKQAAALASILNNPYGLDPANGKDARKALKGRYDYVLNGMATMGNITQAQASRAEKHLPDFPTVHASDALGGQTGHALTLVRKELLALGFTPEQIEGGGLQVTTTLTKKAMDAAAAGVKEARPAGYSDKNLHVAVASVEPGTGALRGFYAGQNFLDSQIDWAAVGGSVGSTMKAVTLSTALEAGYSLKSTFDGNSPYTYPDGEQVHNEGEQAGIANGISYGTVSATYALQQSINTAFIDMTQSIPNGPQKIYDNALKMGIPGPKDHTSYPAIPPGIPATSIDLEPTDPRITLGKAIISPINMANTYATIAAGGEHAPVHIIDKVTDSSGKTLYQYKNNATRAIPQDVSDDVSYALQQVASGGTGAANASPSDLGRPDAGKTGTATHDDGKGGSYVSSSWYVGYTPQLSTAVMYVRGDGNDQLDGWLPEYYGASYPATTWTDVMKRDMAGVPVQNFPPPANVSGTPPDAGHAPTPTYTPPPPKPTHSATPSPTKTVTESPTPPASPSSTPTETSTGQPCTGLLCQPSDTASGGSGGGAAGGTTGDGTATATPAQRAIPAWAMRPSQAADVRRRR